jgi:cytochrome c
MRKALALLLVTTAPMASSSWASADRDLGEYLSSECVTCHHRGGQSSGIPAIVGWPTDSFVEVMTQYRKGVRQHQVMQMIAGRLSDEEVAALAAYFGSLEAGAK